MELFDFIIRDGKSKRSRLDKEYESMIRNIISGDDERSERWETYNLVIRELFSIDNCRYFEEIKYRFTDGEDPNIVILDILSRYSNEELGGLVWFLKRRIDEYLEDDFIKMFF